MADHLPRGAMSKEAAVVSFLLLLIAFSNSTEARALDQLPVAQIIAVQAPSQVSRNEDFSVVVGVEYSRSYSTDIAILDVATGFVLASKGLIIPAGRNDFTFHLTGLDRSGAWMLLASVRVWWHEGWYANERGATFPFQIMISDPANVTLTISSNVPSVVVKIDGVSHPLSSQLAGFSTMQGFHTIEIDPIVTMGYGTRAVFHSWSDDIQSFSRSVYLDSRLNLSATYLTEHLLTVKSTIGQAVGTGWYPAGTNATFAVFDSDLSSDSSVGKVSHKFKGWSGDANSNSPIGSIVVDGPKTVVANWSEDNSQTRMISELEIVSTTFLACSMILLATGFMLRRKTGKQHRKNGNGVNRSAGGTILMLIAIVALAHPSVIQSVEAVNPIQPETVLIDDAVWYHWNGAASDTLLIWLGGGIVEPTTLLINPYEYESYNTIRFIQDLAAQYDVLALKKGSTRYFDTMLNRTIFREPYPGQHNFMKTVKSWAIENEYAYLFIVGYSVGAMAAAKELIVVNPEDWISPNGLIIITTKIAEGVTSMASSLRASLLLLYGDKVAPEFIASGKAFFESAPEDGWRNGSRHHKEYHLIPDVEHEVWTIRDSGEYDLRAVLLTVRFIETCKSLQFEKVRSTISRIALNHTGTTEPRSSFKFEVVSVDAPSKYGTKEAMRIITQARYDLPSNSTAALVAFDTDALSIVSAAERRLGGPGEGRFVNTVLSGESTRTVHLSLVPLIRTNEVWSVITDGVRDVAVDVTDSFSIHVLVGYPKVEIQLDGRAYLTETDGAVTLNATEGEHVISVPATLTIGDETRATFQRWNVTSDSSTIRLPISHDICMRAIYRRQYYLETKSPFGNVSGAGWYDEDSVAFFRVAQPVVISNGIRVFLGWSDDSVDFSPASSVFMNGPKHIQASWKDLLPEKENDTHFPVRVLAVASLVTLLTSLIFAGLSFQRRRASRQNECSRALDLKSIILSQHSSAAISIYVKG